MTPTPNASAARRSTLDFVAPGEPASVTRALDRRSVMPWGRFLRRVPLMVFSFLVNALLDAPPLVRTGYHLREARALFFDELKWPWERSGH